MLSKRHSEQKKKKSQTEIERSINVAKETQRTEEGGGGGTQRRQKEVAVTLSKRHSVQ